MSVRNVQLSLLFFISVVVVGTHCRHPMILLPGDGGSRMLAKLNKTYRSHFWCAKTTDDYFTLWLNLEEMLPYSIECLVDNMRLHYNKTTRRTHNTPGVSIKIPDFGDTSSIEYLDPDHLVTPGQYYASAVEALVSKGYMRGKDIRGAPYDFRKAPNEHEKYFRKLKKLVEETYSENDNKKVVLVGHSMGCTMLLYFLNHMEQTWKDKYVKSMVTMAGPYTGSVKAILAFVSGYNLNTRLINGMTVRTEERSYPSMALFLPSDNRWNGSEVLVRTPWRTYSVDDYLALFKDLKDETGYEMWKDTKGLIYDLTPPGVEVLCLHGVGVKTIERLTYGYSFPNDEPNITYGDGDGTVNRRSLEACKSWIGKQTQKVVHKTYNKVSHMGILKNKETLRDILAFANED